jgi:hypothetical protein
MATTNTMDAVLAQYEQTQKSSSSSTSKMSQDDRMKKYFAAILSDKEKQGQKRIRILPTADGSSPFKEVWFHEVQVDGKWIKLYDPGKNDNERSPLNEVFEELTISGKESDKKLASNYRSRMFYIVKVIDRDAEEDGVKFWRFKHNYKKEGILDKIIPIWRAKGDVTDPQKGRDLILELTKSKTNSGSYYTVIQAVMYDDPQPISDNEDTLKSWVEDELTWADVYSKKPVEYLEAIARGETPKWDSDAGKYTYSDSTVDETVIGGKSKPSSGKSEKTPDPQAESAPDEDMPF